MTCTDHYNIRNNLCVSLCEFFEYERATSKKKQLDFEVRFTHDRNRIPGKGTISSLFRETELRFLPHRSARRIAIHVSIHLPFSLHLSSMWQSTMHPIEGMQPDAPLQVEHIIHISNLFHNFIWNVRPGYLNYPSIGRWLITSREPLFESMLRGIGIAR